MLGWGPLVLFQRAERQTISNQTTRPRRGDGAAVSPWGFAPPNAIGGSRAGGLTPLDAD